MVTTECGGLIIEIDGDVGRVKSKYSDEWVVVKLENKKSPVAEAVEGYKRFYEIRLVIDGETSLFGVARREKYDRRRPD